MNHHRSTSSSNTLFVFPTIARHTVEITLQREKGVFVSGLKLCRFARPCHIPTLCFSVPKPNPLTEPSPLAPESELRLLTFLIFSRPIGTSLSLSKFQFFKLYRDSNWVLMMVLSRVDGLFNCRLESRKKRPFGPRLNVII